MLDLRPTWLKLQPTWLKEKTLPKQLGDVANKLLRLPSSTQEVLLLLDRVEHLLSKVDQSPPDELQKALSPFVKSLTREELLGHSNNDVRIAVIACICEITRITAPVLPYNDDQMKRILKFIVFSIGSLASPLSRSYTKAINILDIVAGTRLFVLMLDLECHDLIHDMFHLFLSSITSKHPSLVFENMEYIMSSLIEENDEASMESISPLFVYLGENNQEVSNIGLQLAKKVLENCYTRLVPFSENAAKKNIHEVCIRSKDISCGITVTDGYNGATTTDTTMALVTKPHGSLISSPFTLRISRPIVSIPKWSLVSIQISRFVMLRPATCNNPSLLDGYSFDPLVIYRVELPVDISTKFEGSYGFDHIGLYCDRNPSKASQGLKLGNCCDEYEGATAFSYGYMIYFSHAFEPRVLVASQTREGIKSSPPFPVQFVPFPLQVEDTYRSLGFQYSSSSRGIIWKYLVYWHNFLYHSFKSSNWKYFHSWKSRPKLFSSRDLLSFLVHWRNYPNSSIHDSFWRYLVHWTSRPNLLAHGELRKYLVVWKNHPYSLMQYRFQKFLSSWKNRLTVFIHDNLMRYLVHSKNRPTLLVCDAQWKYLVHWKGHYNFSVQLYGVEFFSSGRE